MLRNKIRWIILLSMSLLAVMACGQVSLGLVTPTPENITGEIPSATISEPTPVSTIPVSPTSEPEPTETTTPESLIPAIAYVGLDGNLWVLEAGGDTPRQVTFDANPIGNDRVAVEYSFPRLSSDGTLLAYRRDEGTPNEGGYDFTTNAWVVNLANGELHQVLDGYSAGFAWKPGSHLLAYGTAVDINYFMNRGEPDPALAEGIRTIDLDTGETRMLVAPERGYTLSGPNWSPNGGFLAFEEVINMEGSGLFAYYDFGSGEYIPWDEAVGQVSWSPDGGLLTYARHTYAATGEERLYLRPRQGSEQLLGPDYDGLAYATFPLFSPDGQQIAYLAFLDGPETQKATVMVLDLDGGEPKPMGQFEGVWELAWIPDGSQIVFTTGPWESPHIIALNLTDGSQTMLAEGRYPTLAGE